MDQVKQEDDGGIPWKAFIAFAAAILVAFFLFTHVHTCDNCGKVYFGSGYYGYNSLYSANTSMRICDDCASTWYGTYKEGFRAS